jgi:hypothetical protein
MELFNLLFTYIVFGIIGFIIAQKLKQPTSFLHWTLAILLFLISNFVGIDTRVISIFQFTIYLNNSLVGLGIGILSRFIYRRFNHKSAIDVK